jgi:Zn finger protein HypA/HybF involved in hydrogenase expression
VAERVIEPGDRFIWESEHEGLPIRRIIVVVDRTCPSPRGCEVEIALHTDQTYRLLVLCAVCSHQHIAIASYAHRPMHAWRCPHCGNDGHTLQVQGGAETFISRFDLEHPKEVPA